MGEAALRALFDTAQSTNPGKTKLAEGLRAWVKFGTTVTGTGKHRAVESTQPPLLYDKKYAEKILDRRDGFKQFQVFFVIFLLLLLLLLLAYETLLREFQGRTKASSGFF